MNRRRRSKLQQSAAQYENLEVRNLLAGDVTVAFTQGNLYLRGDSENNRIEIIANSDGGLEIAGRNGTMINGESRFETAASVRNLNAYLGDGNDGLELDSINIAGSVRVNSGPGNDRIQFSGESEIGRQLILGTRDGNDLVRVADTTVGEKLKIYSGAGNDRLEFLSVESQDLRMITGAGHDTFFGAQVSIERHTQVYTGSGSDILNFENSQLLSSFVSTGAGADFFSLDEVQLNGRSKLLFGPGHDRLLVENTESKDRIRVKTQAGDDLVWIANSSLEGPNSMAGGSGADRMEVLESTVNSAQTAGILEAPVRSIDKIFAAIGKRLAMTNVGDSGQDTDLDGVSDFEEQRVHGTDPNRFDTDGDLLSDGFEIKAKGLNPLVVDDIHADLDLDQLTNIEEQQFRTKPDVADTDGDGTNDGTEANQGSDPNDASDQGKAPDPSDVVKLKLTVGDHSGSHSERYELQVGGLAHQAPEFGVLNTRQYTFVKGRSYPIRILHRGSKLTSADYDYTAKIEPIDGEMTQFFVVDDHGIMGEHNESDPFFAAGKTATLVIPKIKITTDKMNYSIDSTPKMPTIKAEAQLTGLDGNVNVNMMNYEWKTEIKYDASKAPRGPNRQINFDMTKTVKGPKYVPAFNVIRGGNLTFTVKVQYGGMTIQSTSKPVKVVATNPTEAEVRAEVNDTTLMRIARQESTLRQFRGDHPLWSGDGLGGVGLFQITNPAPTNDEVWNWKSNVATGRRIFNQKSTIAGRHPGRVQRSQSFQQAVNLLNQTRTSQGLPALTIQVPQFTAQQQLNDAIRGFNGWGGSGRFVRHLHEYRVALDSNGMIRFNITDPVNNVAETIWEQVPAADRPQTFGDPDYVNHVLNQNP